MSTAFVDKVTITVRAGDGGAGAVAFHREKYVAAGGPDGGDGGRGGDVVVQVDPSMSTLLDFRYKRKFTAGNGMPGQGKRCSGKDGQDVILRVPKDTVIRDAATGAVMQDMSAADRFVLARGGRGGWGNKHFATPTRQTPHFAKPGLPGEYREVVLELKLLADVGLVGFPNAGKSTLLSVLSRAHPKIADYPFTTLFPNLGVVYAGPGVSFVLADIPGIIEGASEGAGLGHDFLRHIDRCRLLVHVVDVSDPTGGGDPGADFETVNEELRRYSPELAARPQLVVASKCDLLGGDDGPIKKLRACARERGYEVFEISAAAHQGLRELTSAIAERLAQLPPPTVFEADYVAPEVKLGTADDLKIGKYDDVWTLEGDWLDRLAARVNFADYESRMYLDRKLRQAGVYERMEAMGLADGDTISIAEMDFTYYS